MTHYSDRSRYETGMKCPRKRYWNYHHEGTGVVQVGDSFDLQFGLGIHAFIETGDSSVIPVYADYDELTPDGQYVHEEGAALYYGLTETYKRFVQPQIEAEYEWIGREVEMTLDLGSVKWMSRLDGVLRRRSDGLYFLLEVKTTSWPDELQAGAQTNFQLMMELEAMRAHYELRPEQIGGALLLAFVKGNKKRASQKEQDAGRDGYRRMSPFTYWYTGMTANGPAYQLDYTSKKGWERRPTWTIDGWYEILVNNWPEAARAQVQLLPSVGFDSGMLESVVKQVKRVEGRAYIADICSKDVDTWWPQNFANCHNDGGFRRPCPYMACCFQPRITNDPVGSGEYEWRVANHPQENEKEEVCS